MYYVPIYLLFAVHVSNNIFQADINNDFCVYIIHMYYFILCYYNIPTCIDIGIIAKTLFTI